MKVRIIKVPEAANGLTIQDGGAEMVSPSMGKLKGKSHEAGGVQFEYNGSPAEAFGGEHFSIMPNGDMSLFGKQKVILNGKKTTFNKYAQHLSEEENKTNKQIKKASALVENSSPTKWGNLAQTTGRILAEGAGIKQSLIEAEKQTLADLQNSRLAIASVTSTKPQDIPAFKNGGTIPKFDPGGTKKGKWEFNGTRYDKVDKKIKGFVKLLEERGYSGYSGPESGYSERNTKSGRRSRHAKGQALDMFFEDKDPYRSILLDNQLSDYLMQNGLTVLNEYDKNVASKTGATAGHLHIGYDRGTPISEQFRKDVYKQWPGWNPKNSPIVPFPGSNAPVLNQFYGDMQEAPPVVPTLPSPYLDNPNMETEVPFGYTNPSPSPSPIPIDWPSHRGEYNPPAPTPNIPAARRKSSLTERNGFNPATILPEIAGIFQQPDAVPFQQYNPTLYTPYEVNYQDQIDNNNATLRQVAQQLPNNPEALSLLAGQNYAQNSQVMANQFRTNQEINNQVTNQNVQLLNQAELQNLQLQDIQQQRMSQAKSNTRRDKNNAANSIASKIAQNKRENNSIRLYETMSNYRMNDDNNLGFYGRDTFTANGIPYGLGNDVTIQSLDANGVPLRTVKKDDPLTEEQKLQKIRQQQNKMFFGR